jgi:multidrug efflux system membrane fusion protein
VVLGAVEGERVEVTSGLAPGERIVTDGADKLKDGMQVTVQAPPTPAAAAPAAATSAAPAGT